MKHIKTFNENISSDDQRFFYVEDDEINSTEDCVNLLNRIVKNSKWKRKSKFNISNNVARVFSDGTMTVTIIVYSSHTHMFLLDLSSMKDLIKTIQTVAKNYHTVDYGQIFLNPFEMKLWIVGGDGGYCYSTTSPRELAKTIEEEGMDFDSNTPGFEKFIPEITSTEFEDENFPEDEEPWIEVGKINDLCDYF
jgi:hypothetical protein